MSRPTLEEILDVMAEVEWFEETLSRFPGLDRAELLKILRSARSASVPAAAKAPALASPAVSASAKNAPEAKKATKSEKSGARGTLKLWSDGASRGNPGPASVGVVLLDERGEVVDEIAERIGVRTNNYAEYEAVRQGLARAAELGADAVELRADSELVIKQLTGLYRVKNQDLIPLFAAVKALERRFPRGVRYQHVRREQNVDADRLANLALDNG